MGLRLAISEMHNTRDAGELTEREIRELIQIKPWSTYEMFYFKYKLISLCS